MAKEQAGMFTNVICCWQSSLCGRLSLALVLFFALSVGALGAETPYWQHAGELFKAGNYPAALKEAERLLGERPDDVVLLRIKGVCMVELGDADGAVAALRRALGKDPDSVSCRFYLAQALAYQGSVLEAIRLLHAVRKAATDSKYGERAGQILPQLESLSIVDDVLPEKKRWAVVARIAGEYDDNVPERSWHESDSSPISSFRLVTSTYVELRPLDEKIDTAPLTIGVGYSFYQSLHERHYLNNWDLTSHDGCVFLRKSGLLAGMPYQARLNGDYIHARLDDERYSDTFSLLPEFELQWADWAVVTPRYSVAWDRFAHDTDSPNLYSRDGTEQNAGFSQTFYAFDDKLAWGFDYAYRWNHAEGSEFDLNSHCAAGFASVRLPWKLRLATRLEYQSEDYIEFTTDPIRLDDVWTVSASLSRRFWSDRVSAEFSYRHRLSNSKLDEADYRRNIYSMGLTYYF